MPRAVADFVLAPADKATLQGWLRKGSTPNRLAQRARILLLLADKLAPKEISAQHGTSVASVFRWRARYQELGVAGLKDLARPGQPRKLSPKKCVRFLRLPHSASRLRLRIGACGSWPGMRHDSPPSAAGMAGGRPEATSVAKLQDQQRSGFCPEGGRCRGLVEPPRPCRNTPYRTHKERHL